MSDKDIEQKIQEAGLTAPRITPADLEANIASEHYFTAADGYAGEVVVNGKLDSMPKGEDGTPMIVPPEPLELLTFCVLVLKNGFTVTGESACASPENFNQEIGREIARKQAVQKIWPLMGYQLRSQLNGQ